MNNKTYAAPKLLPCPFCGCRPIRQGNGIGDYWLECVGCATSTRPREDGDGVADWNRRAALTPQPDAAIADGGVRAAATGQDVQWEAHLLEVVEHTIDTIGRQLELLAERAPGLFLDKTPVVRSLTAHKQRLERAVAERNASFAAPRAAATVPSDNLSLVRELQKALFYWMPSIAGEDSPAGHKAAEHAYLLIGSDDKSLDCYGDQMRSSLGIVNRELERIGIACTDAGCPEEMEVADFIDDLYARAKTAKDGQDTLSATPTPSDDERDAARYRWLVKNCFDWAAPGEGDHFDHIELHFEHEWLNRDDASVGTAIDHEIYADSLNASGIAAEDSQDEASQ